MSLPAVHAQNTDLDPQVFELIALFDSVFFRSFNTRLVAGTNEPIYLPAKNTGSNSAEGCDFHQIVFAHGYFSSALHEIAHWCIAGEKRRLVEDYGYWYCPDGRNAEQQQAFEQVEIKPQAIEWAFTMAANRRFQVSTDNLNGVEPNRRVFTRQVREQLIEYMRNGFPNRAQAFIVALRTQFKGPIVNLDILNKAYPSE